MHVLNHSSQPTNTPNDCKQPESGFWHLFVTPLSCFDQSSTLVHSLGDLMTCREHLRHNRIWELWWRQQVWTWRCMLVRTRCFRTCMETSIDTCMYTFWVFCIYNILRGQQRTEEIKELPDRQKDGSSRKEHGCVWRETAHKLWSLGQSPANTRFTHRNWCSWVWGLCHAYLQSWLFSLTFVLLGNTYAVPLYVLCHQGFFMNGWSAPVYFKYWWIF